MSESEDPRFLFARYDRVHFLLNREQCAASAFAAEVLRLRSRRPFLRELLCVGGSRLLFFDLHLFLCETFRTRSGSGARLALICELSGFGPATRELFRTSVFPALGSLGVDDGRVALRVPSDTVLRTLRIESLAPHNRSVERPLLARGILALHPEEDSLGFLLDLDGLLGSRLLFAVREGGGSP